MLLFLNKHNAEHLSQMEGGTHISSAYRYKINYLKLGSSQIIIHLRVGQCTYTTLLNNRALK